MATGKTTIDMHNIISSDEAFNIIRTNAETLINNPSLSHAIPPAMIRGAPGVGKSSIVKAVADSLGIGFIDIRLAEMEPVDLRGLPVPNHDEKSVQWYVTSDLPRDPNSKGIILFDELTSADRSLQVASYELILDRRLGNLYKIPDGWYIVACGNRVEDRAVATTMSSALANRLMHFDIEPDAEEWGNWAIRNEIHPSVTGFIKYRPACLFEMDGQNLERGWPSPRSWERVSHMIPLYSKQESILRKVVYSLIGNKVGVEFMQFYNINKNFDDVLEMMTNPNAKIVIPKKSDEIFALCSAMQYLVWKAHDDEDLNKRIDGFMRICIEMESDFASMALIGAMQGNKNISGDVACSKMYNHPRYADWKAAHGAFLRKRYSL